MGIHSIKLTRKDLEKLKASIVCELSHMVSSHLIGFFQVTGLKNNEYLNNKLKENKLLLKQYFYEIRDILIKDDPSYRHITMKQIVIDTVEHQNMTYTSEQSNMSFMKLKSLPLFRLISLFADLLQVTINKIERDCMLSNRNPRLTQLFLGIRDISSNLRMLLRNNLLKLSERHLHQKETNHYFLLFDLKDLSNEDLAKDLAVKYVMKLLAFPTNQCEI